MGERRRCLFGDGLSDSGEHIFPDWMNRHFGKQPTFTVTRTAEDGKESTYPARKIAHLKYPVVCRECNSGWMSQIENETKPILLSLMTGEKRTWDPRAQLQLATWATLKALVIDAHKEERTLLTRRDAAAFRQQLRPFADMRVTIAAQDEPGRFAIGVREVIGYRGRSSALSVAYAITVTMGHLAILVVGHPGSDDGTLRSLGLANDRIRTIMPPVLAGMVWPPPHVMNGAALTELAREDLGIARLMPEAGPPPPWPPAVDPCAGNAVTSGP